MKTPNPKVFVKYTGDEPMSARLFPCDAKVLFNPGDIHAADWVKAKALTTHYKKFIIVESANGETLNDVEDEGEEKKIKRGRPSKV